MDPYYIELARTSLVYVLCCAVFYLFCILISVYYIFYNCLISTDECELHSLKICCDMTLFNMRLIILLPAAHLSKRYRSVRRICCGNAYVYVLGRLLAILTGA